MFTVNELKALKKYLSETTNEELQSIKEKIDETLEKVKDYELCLWNFRWDCGRSGSLTGIFKATKADVERSQGRYVYFGEVLGKHSEVYGDIEEGDITLISDDPIKVMASEESGFDPFEYITDLYFYIGDLSVEQLKRFGECNKHVIDSDDRTEIEELLETHYDGAEADELSYAREYALQKR